MVFAEIGNSYVFFKKDGKGVSPSHKMEAVGHMHGVIYLTRVHLWKPLVPGCRLTDQTLEWVLPLMQFPLVVDLNTTFRSTQYTYFCLIKLNISAISFGCLAACQLSNSFIDQILTSLVLGGISDIVIWMIDTFWTKFSLMSLVVHKQNIKQSQVTLEHKWISSLEQQIHVLTFN